MKVRAAAHATTMFFPRFVGSAMLVRESRTSSANGAFGQQ
jgi:hypothetical protein